MSIDGIHNLGDLIRRDLDQSQKALIDLGGPAGPREFSYAELDQKANAVARGLLRKGLKPGQRVAIVSANRAEYLFCHFGAMRAGLVSVPVNFKFPPALIEFVARDADAAFVFCDSARAGQLPADLPQVVFDDTGPNGFDNFLDPGPFESVRPGLQDPGMFLYTSGSTGKPKGVVLSHHSHVWVSKTRLANHDFSAQRFLIAAPLYHMNALSLGYPHPAAELRLDDGVLQMKSPGVMLGYHKAESRQPKLSSPFTEDGFYITGDIFRVDENGFYFFLGRADDMFVSGGENIYPSEVERLLETHPMVQQAAVLPLEDDIKGYKPAAFVVLKPGSELTAQSLKEYCLQNAPAYQHPRWIGFVEALPLASTNKIDKARLKAMATERLGAALL